MFSWIFGRRPAAIDEAAIVSALQERLNAHGANLAVDGVWGDATDEAISAFKARNRWLDNPTIGRLTLAALFDEPKGKSPEIPDSSPSGEPRWLVEARRYLGEREIAGSRHNPTIVAFWQEVGAGWFKDDETPWCGGFVGAVLKRAGISILSAGEAPRARAWERWGRGLDGPAVGAVVTFWRGSPTSGSGHVGFLVGKDAQGRPMVLGGNQSDAVTIAPFDRSRVTSWRWPLGGALPVTGWDALPVVDSRGAASSANEA